MYQFYIVLYRFRPIAKISLLSVYFFAKICVKKHLQQILGIFATVKYRFFNVYKLEFLCFMF